MSEITSPASKRLREYAERWVEVATAHGSLLSDEVHSIGDKNGDLLSLYASDVLEVLDERNRFKELWGQTRLTAETFRAALEKIASCEVRVSGDVVDIARSALAEVDSRPPA